MNGNAMRTHARDALKVRIYMEFECDPGDVADALGEDDITTDPEDVESLLASACEYHLGLIPTSVSIVFVRKCGNHPIKESDPQNG